MMARRLLLGQWQQFQVLKTNWKSMQQLVGEKQYSHFALSASTAACTNGHRQRGMISYDAPSNLTAVQYNINDFYKIPKRHMAGHSKWQNIKHIKAAKDAQKQTVASDVSRRIKVAIREGGGSNPEFNYKLAQVLRYGVSKNVPKNTLEKAIKDYNKSQSSGSQLFVECRGPSNTFLIVEAFTEKHKWCRQELARILKKYGGAPGNKGTAAHSFDYKGILRVALETDEAPDMDAATETAIEAGAEDVNFTVDENETKLLEYICENTDLHVVKKNLEEKGIQVSEARLGYVPKIYNPLSREELEVLSEALDGLESLDFVVRVYDNAEEKQ